MSAYTLRLYQQEAVDRGVAYLTDPEMAGRNGIIVCPTGAGKSLVIAGIATALPGPCVVFQPTKEILEQNAAKLVSYGYKPAIFSASCGRKEIGAITLGTVGSVARHAEAFQQFPYVLIDECFAAGTLVDGRPIETIRPGETVTTYNHQAGRLSSGRVTSVLKRLAPPKVCRVVAGGRSILCTVNHPFFVEGQGYVRAEDLQIGDRLAYRHLQPHRASAASDAAVHALRGTGDSEEPEPTLPLHDDRPGVPQGVRAQARCAELLGANETAQSDGRRRDAREDGRVAAPNRTSSADPGRERTADAGATAAVAGCPGLGLDAGVRGEYRASERGVPALLQDRPGESGDDDRGGDRRAEPWSGTTTAGREEDGVLGMCRVERVEVYKQGSSDAFGADRPVDLVYNLEVAGDSNYFADGVLVHNCHLVNAKGGMYRDFLQVLEGARCAGLTATPFRLASNSYGSILRFLTRTRPRIFRDVVHVTQVADLLRAGYLAPVEYRQRPAIQREKLRLNSTGADYTDASVQLHFKEVGFAGRLQTEVEQLLAEGRKNLLVFTRFVEESERLAAAIPGAAVVTAETPSADRARILSDFKAGQIRVVSNVGIVALGFDFPALETVVLARPSVSLALFYQQVGRSIRPHPHKVSALVVDLVGLVEQFGRVEDLVLTQGGKSGDKWVVRSKGRDLTNCYFGEPDPKRQAKASYWSGRKSGAWQGGQGRSTARANDGLF